MQGLLEAQIISALSTYVENGAHIDWAKLTTFEFTDLVMKPAAIMDGFEDLPVNLKSMTIASMRLDIPKTSVLTKSVNVEISGFKAEFSFGCSADEYVDKVKATVTANLASEVSKLWEEFQRLQQSLPGEANILGADDTGSYFSPAWVINRIKKNVKVTMKDVVFTLNLAGTASLVIKFDELCTFPTDPTFSRQMFEKENNRLVHRQVRFLGFSISLQPSSSTKAAALALTEKKMTSAYNNEEVMNGINSTLLDPADFDIFVQVNNRADKSPDTPSMDMRVVFGTSLRVNIHPEDLSLLSRFGNEAAKQQLEVERLKARILREARGTGLLSDEYDEYLTICKERWASNLQPPGGSARQKELELRIPLDEVRAMIDQSLRERVVDTVDPKIFDGHFRPLFASDDPALRYLPLKKVSKYPARHEFDVTYDSEAKSLGLELDLDESERLDQLIVSSSKMHSSVIRKGMVITAVNGFSLDGLDLDDQKNLLSNAKRPTAIRFLKFSVVEGQSMRLQIPLAEITFLPPKGAVPLRSEDPPCLRVFGIAAQTQSFISGGSQNYVSLMSIRSPFLNGGTQIMLPSSSDNSIMGSSVLLLEAKERVELASASLMENSELTSDATWRRASSVVGQEPPLITSIVSKSFLDSMEVQGSIGATAALLNEASVQMMSWVEFVGTSGQETEVAPSLPQLPPKHVEKTIFASLTLQQFQLKVDLDAAKRSSAAASKDLIVSLDSFSVKTNPTSPSLTSSQGKFTVKLGSTKLVAVQVNDMLVALDQPNSAGVSLMLKPEPIVISDAVILHLMKTQRNLMECMASASWTPRSSSAQDNDDVDDAISFASVSSHSFKASAVCEDDIVSIDSDALGDALARVLGYTPSSDDTLHLSPVEALDLYLALKAKSSGNPPGLEPTIGLRSHSVQDIMQNLRSPCKPTPPFRVRVATQILQFQFVLSNVAVKFDNLTLGAVTYPEVSVRVTIKNLRLDDMRLRPANGKRGLFSHRFFVVHDTSLSFAQRRCISKEYPQVQSQPFVNLMNADVRAPDPTLICPVELQPQANEPDRDDLHVSFHGVRVRVTYDLLSSLQSTVDELVALTSDTSPSGKGRSSVGSKSIVSNISSSDPITSAEIPAPPGICVSVAVSGLVLGFDDLTRKTEHARKLYRYSVNETAIAQALHQLDGETTVSVSLADGISENPSSGDALIRSVFLSATSQGSVSKAKVNLNYLSLSMSVNQIHATETLQHEVTYTEMFQRSRTIMNPLGMVVVMEQDSSQESNATLVFVEVEKPLSFSVWAEEVSTLNEILGATEPGDGIQAENVTSRIGIGKNALASRPPLRQSMGAYDDDEPQMAPVTNLELQQPAQYERMNSLASSSRESYYTAVQEEPRTSATEGGEKNLGRDKQQKMQRLVLKLICRKEVGLEIVKRSLARWSPDAFLPVLWFVLRPVEVNLYSNSMATSDFAASCLWGMEARIYNLRLAVWEPLIEHFRTELYARKVHENHLKLRLSVVTRINVNVSEVNARLLRKLMNDFSMTKKEGAKYRDMKKMNANGYYLINCTGDPLSIEDLFQVGCGSPGVLKIEVRDIWTLPERSRWQKVPKLEGRVLPWAEKIVIKTVPNSAEDLWLERPLVFSFDYLGTTTEFPILELTVNDEFVAMVELAAHIIDPKEGGTSEWVPLRKTTGNIQAEILLRITFEIDPKTLASSETETWRQKTIEPDQMYAISFDNHSPNRRDLLKHSHFLRGKSQHNTMRGALISLALFGHTYGSELLVDETGSYLMQLNRERNLDGDASYIFSAQAFVKSAMRPGGKRVIQLESPLVITNETDVPIEILITLGGAEEGGGTKQGYDTVVRVDDVPELNEMISEGTESDQAHLSVDDSKPRGDRFAKAAAVVAWREVPGSRLAPPNRQSETDGFGTFSRGLASPVIFKSSELEAPLDVSSVCLHFTNVAAKSALSTRLFGRVAASRSWVQLGHESNGGKVATRPLLSSTDPAARQVRSSFNQEDEEKEEKHESKSVEVSGSDEAAVEKFSVPWETGPFMQFRVEFVQLSPRYQGKRESFNTDRQLLGDDLDSTLRRDSITDSMIAPTSSVVNGGGGHASIDDATGAKTETENPVISSSKRKGSSYSVSERSLLSLGIKAIELISAAKEVEVVWTCKLCLQENSTSSDNCELCNMSRSALSLSASGRILSLDPSDAGTVTSTTQSFITSASFHIKDPLRGAIKWPKRDKTVAKKDIPVFLDDIDRSMKTVLEPGSRFPVPIRYLFVKNDPFKIYVRPAKGDMTWSKLIHQFGGLRDQSPPRTWLRSASPDQKTKMILSGHIQARHILGNISEATREDKRPNRFKIGIVPWLVIQNALPFPLSIRFFDGLVPRDQIIRLAPGEEHGCIDVDEQALVQFKLEDYNSNFTWSATVHPYREDSSGYDGGKGVDEEYIRKRIPRRKEVLTFAHEKSTKLLRLIMERSNDSRASLRCVVYATCWVYNYSDVGISLKGGRSLLGSASAAAVSRTSHTGAPEDSYLLPPRSGTGDLLPALIHSNTELIRVSGVIGWDESQWDHEFAAESDPHRIQPMRVVEIAKLRRLDTGLLFSRPRFNVKLTSSVFACDFLFATVGEIRLVTVEVKRPDRPPFNRSLQVTIRPRFILLNLLKECRIFFEESASVNTPRDYFNELPFPELDTLLDEDEGALTGGSRNWTSCYSPSHKGPKATDDTAQEPNVFLPDGSGVPHDAAVDGGGQGDPGTTATTTVAPSNSQLPSMRTRFMSSNRGRTETSLEYNYPLPFHFTAAKQAHRFRFAAERSLGAMTTTTTTVPNARTSLSGVITIDNSEKSHCVLLRDRNGSAHETARTMTASSTLVEIPQSQGDAMRVRVDVSPRSNGSTVVSFSEDGPAPSFEIDNRTGYWLEVKQAQTNRGNMIVPPQSSLPIGWDEPMKHTSISTRALFKYHLETIARSRSVRNLVSHSGFNAAAFCCKNGSSQPSFISESGAKVSSLQLQLIPASTWQTYAMETVSEREPIQFTNGDVVLRAEGVVRGTTLVLRFSEDHTIGVSPPEQRRRLDGQEAAKNSLSEEKLDSSPPPMIPAHVRVGSKRRNLATETFDPSKCVIAIKIERGENLRICEKWQSASRKKLQPYVVVSVAGHTKQNTAIETGDVYNPLWAKDKPLLFELQDMPHSISFSILNRSTDAREILAIKREDLPKSLFQQAHLRKAMGRHQSSIPVTSPNEQQSTKADDGKDAGNSNDDEADDGWVTIGSVQWESLKDRDLQVKKRAREYERDALLAVRRTKNLDELVLLADPLVAYREEMSSIRVKGNRKDGYIYLGPVFEKIEPTDGSKVRILKLQAEDINQDAVEARDKDEETKSDGFTNEQHKERPSLSVKIKILQLPTDSWEPEASTKHDVANEVDARTQRRDSQDPVRTVNPLRYFMFGQELKFSVFVTSIGVSVINSAKKAELAYACVQRLYVRRYDTPSGFLVESSIGNIQLDSHVPNCQFPVALYRSTAPVAISDSDGFIKKPPFAYAKVMVHTTHPTVMFVEVFQASVARLNIELEERFLGEVAGVLVRSSQGVQTRLRQQVVVQDDIAIVPSRMNMELAPDSAPSDAKRMLYLDSFELFPIRISINLDLEGGRDIDEPDDSIAAGIRVTIPLLTLEVRELVLRIAGMKHAGFFVSKLLLSNSIRNHYVTQALLNTGRILTNTNWAGNPLQAGRSVASGFYFLIREPVIGVQRARSNPVYGFLSGLNSGATALLANLAIGLSETVHGLTNTSVSAFSQLESAIEYDVTSRPMSEVVEMMRDVSGALATSAREINDEVVALKFAKPVHIRRRRELAADGLIISYGGGFLPAAKMGLEERRAALIIQKSYRNMKRIKASVAALQAQGSHRRLGDVLSQAAAEAHAAAPGDSQRKPGFMRRMWNTVVGCCWSFASEVDLVRKANETK